MPGNFTYRSFAFGALLSLAINVFFAYARLAMATAGMSSDYITAGAVFLFFLVVAFINPALKLMRRAWGFNRSELIIIYAMMIIGSAIPTWGFTGNLIAMLPNIYYYATPENNWSELLHPYVREWMVPQDPDAIKYFFEGLPKGQPIPWEHWMVPLAAWVSFILAIYLMMISIASIVRRQWVDYDRLTFPLLQLPIDLTEEGKSGSIVVPLFKRPLLWIGFALPVVLHSTNALNHYFPFIPAIQLRHHISLFNHALGLATNVNFVAIGLAYFLSLDVGLSIWLFHLLTKTQIATENVLGYSLPGRTRSVYGRLDVGVLRGDGGYAGAGAIRAVEQSRLSAAGLAQGSVQRGRAGRFAGDSLVSGGNHRLGFGHRVRHRLADPYQVCLGGSRCFFSSSPFCIFYGLTRIVAEGGLGFARAQMTAQPFVIDAVGTEAIGPSGLVSLGMTFSWAGDLRTMVMASAINGLKLADIGRVRGRPLFWALMLSIAVGLAGSDMDGGVDGVPVRGYQFGLVVLQSLRRDCPRRLGLQDRQS